MLNIIGHRFFSNENPENSLAGILLSVKEKVWGVETDIQLTKDKVPVLFHDKLLNRTTNQTGYLKDWNFSELTKKCILENGESIPSLDDLLKLVKNEDIKLYLEIIDPNSLEAILSCLRKYSLEENSILSSFDHNAIYTAKKINPLQKTMALFECIPLNPVEFVNSTNADEVGIGFESINEKIVNDLTQEKIKTYAWTVNKDIEIKAAEKYGLTGIFTDKIKFQRFNS